MSAGDDKGGGGDGESEALENSMVDLVTAHSKRDLVITVRHGWLIGACYTPREMPGPTARIHFMDISANNRAVLIVRAMQKSTRFLILHHLA